MSKYQVIFENKKMRSLEPLKETAQVPTDSHEERTGNTLVATIDAMDENEAIEKAKALETELQSGMTKEQLNRKQENDTGV